MEEPTHPILDWLSAGDLRSDGLSNEVVRIVLAQPELFEDLLAGLDHPSPKVRAHTADALEKITRSRPEWLEPHTDQVLRSLRDEVYLVRMHMAMVLGHLAFLESQAGVFTAALQAMLHDTSVATVCWSIVSLCILGRLYPERRESILKSILAVKDGKSAAIRAKIRYAVPILGDEAEPFPKGWIKGDAIAKALA